MKYYMFRNSDRVRLGPYRAEVLDLLFEILPLAFRSDFQYCDSATKKWAPFLTYQPQSLQADLPPPAPTESLTLKSVGISPKDMSSKELEPRGQASKSSKLSVEESNSEETEHIVVGLRVPGGSQISQLSQLSTTSPVLTGLTGTKGGVERRRDDRAKYQQPVVLIDGLREFVTTTVDVSMTGFRTEDPLPFDFPKTVRVQMDVLDLGLIELEAELVPSAREARDRFRVIGQSSRLGIQEFFALIGKATG